MAFIKLLATIAVGLVFGVIFQVLAIAARVPESSMSGLVCGCVGMFIALVIIGKANE